MKAIIYARYSCDNQREESIEGQLRECKVFAEHKEFTLVGTYIDRAVFAKTDNRPEFQKMIKDRKSVCADLKKFTVQLILTMPNLRLMNYVKNWIKTVLRLLRFWNFCRKSGA